MHGFSDHINSANEFFDRISSHGIQVLGWDQRGWGRSALKQADKGLTGTTAQVVADIAAFIKDKLPSEVPVFVIGHSMGGGEVITLAGDPHYKDLVSQIRGWILEAPFIGFHPEEEPSRLKVYAGRLFGKLLPHHQLVHGVSLERVSRDPAVVQSIRDDPLCHDTGTLEGLASLLDRTAALSSATVPLGGQVQSLLLMHGTDDRICSYAAAIKWYELQTIADKTVKSYEGGYHQLHTDILKEQFFNDLVEWILKQAEGSAPVASKL